MDYQLIRTKRLTIAMEVTPQGTLVVRAPFKASIHDIEAFIKGHEAWIAKQLATLPVHIEPLTAEAFQRLHQEAKRVLPEKVAYFAERLGISYGRVTIRCQKTRWGSCSSKGAISLNCLLLLAPQSVQEYVIVHELCHCREMNHGPAFWQLVAEALPTYQKERQWLKTHGSVLMARRGENG